MIKLRGRCAPTRGMECPIREVVEEGRIRETQIRGNKH